MESFLVPARRTRQTEAGHQVEEGKPGTQKETFSAMIERFPDLIQEYLFSRLACPSPIALRASSKRFLVG
jgi:hypothetical protein